MDTLKDKFKEFDSLLNSFPEKMKEKIRIKAEQEKISIYEYLQKIITSALNEVDSDPNYKL